MQQFVVPQFIDVEDKIFGPITTRQFLILMSTGLIIFLAYKYADFALFLTVTVIFGSLALLFSFVKVNGQNFHYFMLNILQTLRKPSLRIWNKGLTNDELDYLRLQETAEVIIKVEQKIPGRTYIRDLSLLVNTGGFYHPEDMNQTQD